jgi:hypothetical protein
MGRTYDQLFTGRKRASELPRTAHADAHPDKRRVLPFGNFTVVRGDHRGKKVNLRAARENYRALAHYKKGLTLGLPHPTAVIYSREA